MLSGRKGAQNGLLIGVYGGARGGRDMDHEINI
jgi:hypothetical protein